VADNKMWTRLLKANVANTLGFLAEDAQLLVVAHLALESGFGESRAARMGNNLGNLTAGSAWTGAKWTDVGGDQDAAGKLITQEWRKYADVPAFLRDYWSFLGPRQNGNRYQYARSLIERAQLGAAAQALHDARYFELAVPVYTSRWEAALDAVHLHLKP